MLKDIEREYFEWMYNLIIDNGYSKSLSYKELMWFFYTTEFTYLN